MINRILLLSIAFFFFFAPEIPAQDTKVTNNFFLEDGGFLYGQLVQRDSAGWTTLRLLSGEMVRLQSTSILKISANKKEEIFFEKGKNIATKGFYFGLQTGILVGTTSGRSSDVTAGVSLFSLSFGHRFNKHWQLGAGLAFDSYDHQFVPLFIETRWYPAPNFVSPYLGLQTAYSFSFDLFESSQFGNYGGGPMIHPAIGFRIAGRGSGDFLLEAGYRFQWGTAQSTRWGIDQLTYRRLAIRFGWEF